MATMPTQAKRTASIALEASGAGFFNAVLQAGLWIVGGVLMPARVKSEGDFYGWIGSLVLVPVLWGTATVVWVVLLRWIDVEDWKVLVGLPAVAASLVTMILLVLWVS